MRDECQSELPIIYREQIKQTTRVRACNESTRRSRDAMTIFFFPGQNVLN